MKCRVCPTEDKDKPMVFRQTDHCSDNHRKVISGELKPTQQEILTMDSDLLIELKHLEDAKRGVR